MHLFHVWLCSAELLMVVNAPPFVPLVLFNTCFKSPFFHLFFSPLLDYSCLSCFAAFFAFFGDFEAGPQPSSSQLPLWKVLADSFHFCCCCCCSGNGSRWCAFLIFAFLAQSWTLRLFCPFLAALFTFRNVSSTYLHFLWPLSPPGSASTVPFVGSPTKSLQ